MNTSKHKVVLTEMEHRSVACYGIGFYYNYNLKEIVKSIDNVQWSASKKTFYVAKEKLSLHRLYTVLNEKGVYVDYSGIKKGKSTSSEIKTKRVPRKINDENKEVIRAFVRYLRGLRLSENTVKVYFTFVADFVEFIGEKPLDELTNTEVRLFVERQVQYKRYAISTHRQLVSAIKHFGTFLPDSNIIVDELMRPSKSRFLPTVLSKEEVIDLVGSLLVNK